MVTALILSAFLAAVPADAQGTILVKDFDAPNIAESQRLFDERVKAGDKVILFKIDSHGGNVELGMDFIHHVQETKGSAEIVCLVSWKAYSMGFLFLQGACDRRLMTADALMMTHAVQGGARGKVEEMMSAVEMMTALNESIAHWVSARLGIDWTTYLGRTAVTEWWMDATHALANHAVDEVLTHPEMPPAFAYAPKEDAMEDLLKILQP